MSAPTKGGWGFPVNSRKAHWFKPDGIALCGKWMFWNDNLDDSAHDSPDNCRECRKKRLAMEPKP